MQEKFKKAADIIKNADMLIIGAGAGLGVDSGLPDFRGNKGFWEAYPALGKSKMEFMDVASPSTFLSDPRLAWGFYGHRLNLYRDTIPNKGFDLLMQLSQNMEHGYAVFTSNVDGQFQKAGYDPEKIYECHGSIHHLQCLEGCTEEIWSAEGFVPVVDSDSCRLVNDLPTCPNCGGLARPNILMFGDWGWNHTRAMAQNHKLDALIKKCQNPVVIEIGAGTAIPSVRHFSQSTVQRKGGNLIRINPRESDVRSNRDVGLEVGTVQALERIFEYI